MTFTFDTAADDEFAKILFKIQADIQLLEDVAIGLQDTAVNNKNRSRGSLVPDDYPGSIWGPASVGDQPGDPGADQ
jgi:hypothetical protein